MSDRARLNAITESIIGAAIQVHRTLGPGLLESAYVACLAYELGKRNLAVEQQKAVPLIYEQVKRSVVTEWIYWLRIRWWLR
jgi:GxxExxY protein